MMLKKRKVVVYLVLALVLITQTAFSGSDQNPERVVTADVAADQDTNDTANKSDESDPEDNTSEEATATLNVIYKNSLASSNETDESSTSDEGDFANKVISYTQERLCIYSQADITSEVVGVMYPGSVGTIVEKGSEFTKITSGDVTGYARNVDLLFGSEADDVAPTISSKTAEVTIDSLPVLAEANSFAEKIGTFNTGDSVDVYDETEGFLLVTTEDGNYGYIDKECVNVTYDLSNALTIAQENELIAQQKAEEESIRAAEEERKAKEAAAQALASNPSTGASTSVGATTRSAIGATDEEIHLLACIIQWEAGWEGYDGKLAVANVVINRMLSSRFAQNTISTVIYSPGQFTGVTNSDGGPSDRFAALLAKSNDELQSGCYQAAVEALNGKNNIGDYLFFISVGKANYSKYSSYMILNNHCFYLY